MSFTITNNLTIRQFYGDNRAYLKKSTRQESTPARLNAVDSSALRKAIRALRESEYSDEKDTSSTTGSVKNFAKRMKAFVDVYNNTVSGAKENSSDRDVKNTLRRIKSLTSQYEDELDNAGIRVQNDGTLKVSDSSSVKSTERFESIFGEDSDYLKDLDKLARRIHRHVDVAL